MRWWGWIALGLVLCMVEVGTAMAARREAVRLQGLALLAEPRDGATMVRALRVGETVTVAGRNGNWVEVVLADGTHGYVQGGFLTGFSDIPPIAAYANRIDATVVRPAQTGEEKGLSVAAADKAVPVVPEKNDQTFRAPAASGTLCTGGGWRRSGRPACLSDHAVQAGQRYGKNAARRFQRSQEPLYY